MNPQPPPRTREEQIAYNNEVLRQHELLMPTVRLSRTKRRALAACFFLVFATAIAIQGVVAATTSSSGRSAINPGLFSFAMAGFIAIYLVILISVGGLKKPNQLDERERAIRDHSTAVAYRVVAVLVVILCVVEGLAAVNTSWIPFPPAALNLLPYSGPFIWLLICLPYVLLAWTLPDPEPF